MEKEISCGFLIFNEDNAIFASHPTGARWGEGSWSVPKGRMEPGETPYQTAIRELKEETNIDISEGGEFKVIDCGQMEYRPEKDLHLFAIKMNVDMTKVFCASTFLDEKTGITKQENDAFMFNKDVNYFNFSLRPVIEKVLAQVEGKI